MLKLLGVNKSCKYRQFLLTNTQNWFNIPTIHTLIKLRLKMTSNSLSDLLLLNYGQKIVFSHPIHKSDICNEAYIFGKIVAVEKNLITDLWVAECINPNIVSNLQINDFLCSALTSVNCGAKVNLLIPGHINQLSLAASAYRSAKMHGITVTVKIQDNYLVISRKETNLEIVKAVDRLVLGQEAIIKFRNGKELNRLRTLIHRNSYGISVKTNKVGSTLVVTPDKETKQHSLTKHHHLSEKATFYRWLDNLPWDDEPQEYPLASLSAGNYKYFSQLASKHVSKSVKVKDGLFTKHLLCYAKEKGLVVVRYRGETIFETLCTSVSQLRPDSRTDTYDHVKQAISRHLAPLNKTYEDIR